MFRWFWNLEVGSSENKAKKITILFLVYVLPFISTFTMMQVINNEVNLYFGQTLIHLIIFNIFAIFCIQYYIQKILFKKLETDVIAKFVPDKLDDYVMIRLFMVTIKLYLPIIIPSVLAPAIFFQQAKLYYYICALIVIISAIMLNVVISIYLRVFMNTAKKSIVKLGVGFFFGVFLLLFFYVQLVIPYSFLENLETSLKQTIETSMIQLDILILFIFASIGMLSCIIFSFSKSFLKQKARLLIFQRDLTTRINTRKVEWLFEKIYCTRFSVLEKQIFNKDIKEILRESKYTSIIFSIFHIFIFLSVLFLNFIDPVDSIDGAVSMNRILTGLMIVQTIFCLIGSIGFKNHITIENDLELLKKYNISFLNSDVIRAKTRILSAIVFPKLYFIFTILILSNVFQVNGYLSFLYFLSAIQVIIIKKTLELWRVKEANKLNSENAIINFISMTLIMVSIVCFIVIYRNDYETYIIGQLFLIGVTIVNYLFHLFINKDREAEVVSC